MILVLAVLAGAGAWVLDGALWSSLAGGALLALAAFSGPARLPAAAVAPTVLASTVPLPGVLDARVLAVVALAVVATLPLFLLLGGRMPWLATPWTLGAALLAVALVLLAPWGGALTDSDIATRAQALLLAAAALVVFALAPQVRPHA